jgi:N-acyl homoserine lactone hydrolase
VKVYLLSGGILDLDRAVIFPGDDSRRRVTVPVMQVLIDNQGQRVLFDTGVPAEAAGDPEGLKQAYGMETNWIRPLVGSEQIVDRQLALLGLTPGDLDLVVNTHMHFDHAGGNRCFAGVPIAAQEAELEVANSEDYLPIWDAPGLQFRVERGDWSPLPGVEMIHTPGHTPGHQSMLVRLPGQPWLFTWDAVYTEEHWRSGKLGAVGDVTAARESIDRLRALAEQENARIIFGHDIAQWEALGMGTEPKLVVEG